MTEIFKQRKAELEIAAKNTIVEIHLIKMNAEAMAKTMEVKEKMLDSIDAAIRELDHLETLFNIEEKEAEEAEKEKAKEAEKEKEKEKEEKSPAIKEDQVKK